MSRTMRILIVDDEPIARRRLRRLLADESDLEVVGECSDVDEARSFLATHAVDVLFLDIQMPGGDGFTLLEGASEHRPAIVFVTAFEEHAVRAFEVEATDCVRELERAPSGDHTLILDSGARLTLSRSHREAFERAIEGRGDLPAIAPGAIRTRFG